MADLLLKFIYGTQAQYDALDEYDEGTLYWITDTLALYKGDKLYNGGVKIVPTLPSSPSFGVLYILSSNWTGQIWTGNSWKIMTKPFTDTIDANNPSNTSIPTEKAIVQYMTDISNGSSQAITNVSYDNSNISLEFKNVKQETVKLPLNGVAHNINYDTENREVTIPIVGMDSISFSIPEDRDLVVKAGKYVPLEKEIWLSIDPDGNYANVSNIIKIPVAEMIQDITVSNTNTLKLNYDTSNNNISGNVVISSNNNNSLQNSNGLFVDISNKINVISNPIENNIPLININGNLSQSNILIGGQELSTNINSIAIESAVSNKITSEFLSAKNYTNVVNSNMTIYVNTEISNALSWKTLE